MSNSPYIITDLCEYTDQVDEFSIFFDNDLTRLGKLNFRHISLSLQATHVVLWGDLLIRGDHVGDPCYKYS